jgi:hypothetical protein
MSALAGARTRTRYRDALPAPPLSVGNQLIFTACAVSMRFRNRTPSAAELVKEFGMCRATAYRWRGALMAAKGECK